MLSMTCSREVAAPPERVFDVATDLRNAAGRIRSIAKLDVLTDGPVRVGTRIRETRKVFGREATEEMEIVAFDPPRSYVLGCDTRGCRYRTEFRVVPKGRGSDLQMHFQAEPLTFMAKVMGMLMRPMAKKLMQQCAKDLDDIAAHAEGR